MSTEHRSTIAVITLLALGSVAAAQPAPPPQPQPTGGQPTPGQPTPQPTPAIPPNWPPGTPYPGQPGAPAIPGQPGYPGVPTVPAGYPQPGQPGYPPAGYPQPGQPGYPPAGYPQPGQPGYPGMPAMPGQPGYPAMPGQPGYSGQGYPGCMPPTAGQPPMPGCPAAPPAETGPKKPKKGDFDAGGQARFPSGPDETGGNYGTWNWVAVDIKGQYNLLDAIKVYGSIPLAIIKPDKYTADKPGLSDGVEPKMFGGFMGTMEIKIPKIGPMTSMMKKTDVGLTFTGAYMHEGAMLLSEKDFPLFIGNYTPGLNVGLIMKVGLADVVDFSLLPLYVYQASGLNEAQDGMQLPMSLILKIGDLIKLQAELGVYTGDNFGFRAKNGGRLQTGGSLDVKIGKILLHAGIGAASLITGEGSAYPTIRDSFYIDLNAKYAK